MKSANTMKRLSLLLSVSFCCLMMANAHSGDGELNFVTETLSVKIPKPLSDLTATVLDDDVYLAGGCDNPDGNIFVADGNLFACPSVSSSLYRFNADDQTIEELPPMPRQRYRHAAVGIAGKIWLVGGRNADDNNPPSETMRT